jgi:hypothetical protein
MRPSPIRKMLWVSVMICFASGYVVSYEDGGVTVTISNGTSHYLHVLIDNQSYVYVAPGASAQTETGRFTVYVEAYYSPGQGVSGRAVRELSSVSTSTHTDSQSNTCSNNSSGGCQSDMSTSVESGYSRSPMSWRVTPADFTADSTSFPN